MVEGAGHARRVRPFMAQCLPQLPDQLPQTRDFRAQRRGVRFQASDAAPVTGATHPSAAGAGRVGGGRPEMGTIIWHALTATIATYAIGVLGARIGWDTTAFGVVIINGILIFIPHDNSDDAAL